MSLTAELMISGTLGLSGSLRLYLDALFDSLSLRGLETVGHLPCRPAVHAVLDHVVQVLQWKGNVQRWAVRSRSLISQ